MTRRNRKTRPDQDLALALARLEAAFGPVKVLNVHPNPHATGHRHQKARCGDDTAQAAFDLEVSSMGAGS